MPQLCRNSPTTAFDGLLTHGIFFRNLLDKLPREARGSGLRIEARNAPQGVVGYATLAEESRPHASVCICQGVEKGVVAEAGVDGKFLSPGARFDKYGLGRWS